MVDRRGCYREVGAVEAATDELHATGHPHVTTRVGAGCPVGGEDGGTRQ